MDSRFPDKLFYRIGDVSEITGIKPLFYATGKPNSVSYIPARMTRRQRIYERRDVELVIEIKKLLYEQRYTISGAKKFLARQHKQVLKKSVPAKAPGDMSAALNMPSRTTCLLALLDRNGRKAGLRTED